MSNIPFNPQSPSGHRIALENADLEIPYSEMWSIAKAMDIPACKAMW